MIRQELLDMLCCPACRGDLTYSDPAQTLTCRKCGNVYHIKDDIPIMLTDDADGQ